MENSQKHYAEQNELDTKDYILHDYIYVKLKRQISFIVTESTSVVAQAWQ